MLNSAQLFVVPWTVAHQAPLPMEFSRQEYWSGVSLPSPKITVAPQKEFLPQGFSYLLFLMCPCVYTVTHTNVWAPYRIPQFISYLSKSCLPLVF